MFSFFKKKNNANYITIGVTGSYGKSVVVKGIHGILKSNGAKVAYLSSEGFCPDGENLITDINSYNIDAKSMALIRAELDNTQPTVMIIEIPLGKLHEKFYEYFQFDTAIVTTMKNWRSKVSSESNMNNGMIKFGNCIVENGLLVINGDNTELTGWITNNGDKLKNNVFCSSVKVRDLKEKRFSLQGISFLLHDQLLIQTRLIGKHNFINLYLASQACLRYLDITAIANGVSELTNPKGSFDMFTQQPYKMIIDAAKTPEQITESLQYIYQTKAPNSSIITVFGSPYYEDSDRRINAEVATSYSDLVMFAPNDPNDQHVSNINSELHGYGKNQGGATLERYYSTDETNMSNKENLKNRIESSIRNGMKPMVSFDYHDYTGRLDAITTAMRVARPNDIIYIPGKGTERSILFDNIEYEWSDYEAAKIGITNT